MTNAQAWIDRLQLRRHPEGGWFRETYRSEEILNRAALPSRFGGDRAFSTAIYFLIEGEDFSALHRIEQDEIFHFYDGSSLTLHVIDTTGNYAAVKLGRDLGAGELPQAVMSAGSIFGATVNDPRSYSLVGCTVAPGFDFADFAMPSREEMCRQFPQHRQIVERLTR
ncbi:MAG TPA: cupin domain-containing protein [Planctomycetaceae bacterium]|nr:cupin domain-containing protein [Planctomycetaceae bacterium]